MAAPRQSPLISVLIVVIGAVLGYLYSSAQDPTAVVPATPVLGSVEDISSIRIDYQFLQSDAFKSLRVYGELPVVPERDVRNDPF